jgi:hypothetical protein
MSIGADDLEDQLDYSFEVNSDDGAAVDNEAVFSDDEVAVSADEEQPRKRRASDEAHSQPSKKSKKSKSKKLSEKV